jgi:hypothetical protein
VQKHLLLLTYLEHVFAVSCALTSEGCMVDHTMSYIAEPIAVRGRQRQCCSVLPLDVTHVVTVSLQPEQQSHPLQMVAPTFAACPQWFFAMIHQPLMMQQQL